MIKGVERYSNYTGYGDGFEWNGDCRDKTPLDSYGRRRTTIVAIDATRFNKPADQYSGSLMLREVTKVDGCAEFYFGLNGMFYLGLYWFPLAFGLPTCGGGDWQLGMWSV